jgi:hypothetical protein
MQHNNGPLPANMLSGTQFKKAIFENFTLSVKSPDNVCTLKDGSIIMIFNFININEMHPSGLIVMGKRFLKLDNLYEKPCESSVLKIYKASKLSSLLTWPITDVETKNVAFPVKDYYKVFPLLHSCNI